MGEADEHEMRGSAGGTSRSHAARGTRTWPGRVTKIQVGVIVEYFPKPYASGVRQPVRETRCPETQLRAGLSAARESPRPTGSTGCVTGCVPNFGDPSRPSASKTDTEWIRRMPARPLADAAASDLPSPGRHAPGNALARLPRVARLNFSSVGQVLAAAGATGAGGPQAWPARVRGRGRRARSSARPPWHGRTRSGSPCRRRPLGPRAPCRSSSCG